VRAFDLDERLVGVAFLDVGVYVTTMRSLKNLLIIGDAVKSVWFVAFQVRALSPSLQGNFFFADQLVPNTGRPIQTRHFSKGCSKGLCDRCRLFLCGRAAIHRHVRRRRRHSDVRV
jgi:hypothetical protein